MYIDELNRKAKIGKVSIDIKDNRAIRIWYTYPKGKRNKLYAGTVTDENCRDARFLVSPTYRHHESSRRTESF